jgi:hypothetical protein
MLKIRLIAVFISLILTALTLYIAPKIYFAYVQWSAGFTDDQKQLMNIAQMCIGFAIAGIGFWLWKRKSRK